MAGRPKLSPRRVIQAAELRASARHPSVLSEPTCSTASTTSTAMPRTAHCRRVSFLKPGDDDGHPGYSTLAAFEQFVTRAVDEVQNNPRLWKQTATFVTFDESGGCYDAGYVQPISFFGDGLRIPMVVMSPFAKPGYISHTYTDHVSLLSFIERNWRLGPLSGRQPRQPARPRQLTRRSLCPHQPAGHRRRDGLLRLPSCRGLGGATPRAQCRVETRATGLRTKPPAVGRTR